MIRGTLKRRSLIQNNTRGSLIMISRGTSLVSKAITTGYCVAKERIAGTFEVLYCMYTLWLWKQDARVVLVMLRLLHTQRLKCSSFFGRYETIQTCPKRHHTTWTLKNAKQWSFGLFVTTSTPQLAFKTPHIPTNRDQKALNNRGTLGGLGIWCLFVLRDLWGPGRAHGQAPSLPRRRGSRRGRGALLRPGRRRRGPADITIFFGGLPVNWI